MLHPSSEANGLAVTGAGEVVIPKASAPKISHALNTYCDNCKESFFKCHIMELSVGLGVITEMVHLLMGS